MEMLFSIYNPVGIYIYTAKCTQTHIQHLKKNVSLTYYTQFSKYIPIDVLLQKLKYFIHENEKIFCSILKNTKEKHRDKNEN